MANLKRKIEILRDVALANIFKIRVKYDLIIRHRINVSKNIESSIVVSLTSYGQRLRHSVEYSIYSLLKQNCDLQKLLYGVTKVMLHQTNCQSHIYCLNNMVWNLKNMLQKSDHIKN